jgi:hypothetical protein
MSTQSVLVSVTGPVVNTGLSAQSAQDKITIHCVGFVNQGQRWLHDIIVDGDGRTPEHNFEDDGPADANYPLPGGVRYSLLCRIGGQTVSVGTARQFFAPAVGPIFVLANDDKPFDNKPEPKQKQTPWLVSVDLTQPDPPPPPSTPGLSIEDIEIIQVTQSATGDSVLVGGKTTLVRAYLTVHDRSKLPVAPLFNGYVRVRPTQMANLSDTGLQFFALNPTGAGNAVVVRDEGSSLDKNQTSVSLNFEVPGGALPVNVDISHFTFEVVVWIGQEKTNAPGFSSRDQRSAGFWFMGHPVSCSFVLIRAPVNGVIQFPNFADLITRYNDAMVRLPVADNGFSLLSATPLVIQMSHDVGGDGSRLADVFGDLKTLILLKFILPANPNDTILAWAPANPGSGLITTGIAPLGGKVLVATDTFGVGDVTIAHELCHTFRIRHANCGNPKDVDETLPVALDAQGWDTLTKLVVPSSTNALMSDCTPEWTTETEYQRAHTFLTL